MNNENKIGALWKKQSRSGVSFMSGKINWRGENIKITVFQNSYKNNDKQPDFNIIASNDGNNNYQNNNYKKNNSFDDDEVPF